jgi:hypothetical protein
MTDLFDKWIDYCFDLAMLRSDLYSGARKIHRNQSLSFKLDDSLQLSDAGYTKSKLTMLTKNYVHDESRAVAIDLWNFRRKQAKYGSVSFTCYNHFVKNHGITPETHSKNPRTSIIGPCLQSVIITWLAKDRVAIDIPYRTTELFKKFPADLVFIRDVLLEPFDFHGMEIDLNCWFANITIHPMYSIIALPYVNWRMTLESIKLSDSKFHTLIMRWLDYYLRGTSDRFNSARHAWAAAQEHYSPSMRSALISYIDKHQIGKAAIDEDDGD